MDVSIDQKNLGLAAEAVSNGEARRTRSGAISVTTGQFTGRSPRDKYIVDEPGSSSVIWWGSVNQPMSEPLFDDLVRDVEAYLTGQQTWTEDLAVGAAPEYRYPVRLTTERAWVALFSRHMFIVPEAGDGSSNEVPIRILHAPSYQADAERFKTRSSTVIALHPTRRTIVIVGTEYAGEVKKSVFSLLQYLLPMRGVATMHCSATVDAGGDASTLFFGLSGTGKTTLSNDPVFRLVGDDEHGWSREGIFNLEGGSYAKVVDLSEEAEPAIFAATHQPATVWENVVLTEQGDGNFHDRSLTENTRSAYSLSSMMNSVPAGTAASPSRIILLTADASGVLPPVARLTREQAIGLFLLGFTSKIAGTERGLTEPEMTFSPTFGGPFLALPPERYAELLLNRIDETGPSLWMVNTGWSRVPGMDGKRIPLANTRSIVRAIVDGSIEGSAFVESSPFHLSIPVSVKDVPAGLLNPRDAWTSTDTYDLEAEKLKVAFLNQARSMDIAEEWLGWLDGVVSAAR